MHHWTRNTDDAAEVLARLAQGCDLSRDPSGVKQQLSSNADFLREIYQTHHFFPVLRYFHYHQSYYELPCILMSALDTASLSRTVLAEPHYNQIIHSPEVDGVIDAATLLMSELVSKAESRVPTKADAARWRKRYEAAVTRLSEAGLKTRADSNSGRAAYIELRAQWDRPLSALADMALYEW